MKNYAKLFTLVLTLALLVSTMFCISVSAAEEAETDKTGKILAQSVIYGEKTYIQFAVKAETAADVTVTYQWEGDSAVYTASEYTGSSYENAVIFVTDGVALYELGKKVTATVTVGGEPVDTKSYSVAEFLYRQLYNNDVTGDQKAFYESYLECGANAQKYIAKETGNLVNASTIVSTNNADVTINGGNYVFDTKASLEVTPVWGGEGTVEGWKITENGVEKTVGLTFTCSGDVEVVEPLFHVHTPGEVAVENNVAPGCEAEGSYDNVVYCTDTDCGEELSRETITVDATGHSYGDWSVATAPTYYSTGTEVQSCACGATNESVVDKLVAPDNLVTSFDTADSLNVISRYWNRCNLSIDNTIVHGDDKGSLKAEITVAGDNYILLKTPLNGGDFSEYDYISFWVYNDGSAEFSMGTTWTADTVCKVGEWTEVRITADKFGSSGSVSDMAGIKLEMSDISKMPLRIFNAGNMTVGDCFYISSVRAVKYAEDNVAVKFDEAADLNTISVYWPTASSVSIDTTVKHGTDKGSLKVEATAANYNYFILSNPYNTDFSAYDYISFWVYNPGSTDIKMGTTWAADTTCVAGQWTEVKITKAMFEASKVKDMNGTVITMANITNLPLRLITQLAVGDIFYISSVRGGMNAAE